MKHNMKCLVLLDVLRTCEAGEGNSSIQNSNLHMVSFLSNKHVMIIIGIEISWQLDLMFLALRIAVVANFVFTFNFAVVPLILTNSARAAH